MEIYEIDLFVVSCCLACRIVAARCVRSATLFDTLKLFVYFF